MEKELELGLALSFPRRTRRFSSVFKRLTYLFLGEIIDNFPHSRQRTSTSKISPYDLNITLNHIVSTV
jgi:hypothetical protein